MLQQIVEGYLRHYCGGLDHYSVVCFENSVDIVTTDADWLKETDTYLARLNLKRHRTENSVDAQGIEYLVGVYCLVE